MDPGATGSELATVLLVIRRHHEWNPPPSPPPLSGKQIINNCSDSFSDSPSYVLCSTLPATDRREEETISVILLATLSAPLAWASERIFGN
jgi:hypothetical protein